MVSPTGLTGILIRGALVHAQMSHPCNLSDPRRNDQIFMGLLQCLITLDIGQHGKTLGNYFFVQFAVHSKFW